MKIPPPLKKMNTSYFLATCFILIGADFSYAIDKEVVANSSYVLYFSKKQLDLIKHQGYIVQQGYPVEIPEEQVSSPHTMIILDPKKLLKIILDSKKQLKMEESKPEFPIENIMGFLKNKDTNIILTSEEALSDLIYALGLSSFFLSSHKKIFEFHQFSDSSKKIYNKELERKIHIEMYSYCKGSPTIYIFQVMAPRIFDIHSPKPHTYDATTKMTSLTDTTHKMYIQKIPGQEERHLSIQHTQPQRIPNNHIF